MEFTVTDVNIFTAPTTLYGSSLLGIASATINEDVTFKSIEIISAGIVDGQDALIVSFKKSDVPPSMQPQIQKAVYEKYIRM